MEAAYLRIRDQLLDRRERLARAIDDGGPARDMLRLLAEVDAALARVNGSAFGRCEVCREPVEHSLLVEHPLIQYCLCDLTPEHRRAIERDLELAARVQWSLLPPQDLRHAGWEAHFRYLPAGPVSGDSCDLVMRGERLYLLAGDVSGKGVAAALFTARLNALLRGLIEQDLPLDALVARANASFGQSAVQSHYATLVAAALGPDGTLELCNAGHAAPLVVRRDGVTPVPPSGVPLGLFGESSYTTARFALAPGEMLLVHTDGLTEARDAADDEYGVARVVDVVERERRAPLGRLVATLVEDLTAFRGGGAQADDVTIVALRRTG